jgi:hypothetical protein
MNVIGSRRERVMSRPCRIEWSKWGLVSGLTDQANARELIYNAYPHAVIESDNGEVDQVLAWRDAQTAGLEGSAVAVIRFES